MPDLRRSRRALALVFTCAVLAHITALAGSFAYDDFHSVRDNEALRSLANIPSYFWDLGAFSSTDARMYRPVLLVTLALDHVIGDGAAFAFKLTDVLIHALCAALVFSLARRLRADFRAAVLAGLLFGVHPLGSEAVNFVSSRSDQLVALGALLALRLHFGAFAGHRGALLGSAAATLLACGAKETGVVVPALLLVLEGARALRRGVQPSAVIARVLPSILVAVAYLAARRALFGVATVAVPRMTGGGDVTTGAGRDLLTQFAAMGSVLPRFVAQTALPVGLSADPFVPLDAAPTDLSVLAGWAVIALVTALGLSGPRRRPGAFVGTCMAWAIALPWVAIPLNSPANEHRFYGCLAGIAVALGAAVPGAWLRSRRSMAAIGAVLLVFAGVSVARGTLYRDARFLWEDALAGNPRSTAALRGLAQAHQDDARVAFLAGEEERGRRALLSARDFAYRALGLQPRNVTVLEGLVRYEMALGAEHGRPMVGVVHADSLVALRPKDPFARVRLSRALAQAGVATGEARFFEEADRTAMSILEIAAPKGLVYRVAAEALVAQGDLAGALARLDEAFARGFDHYSVRLDRADVLLRMGRAGECAAEARRVLAEAPFERRALELIERSRGTAAPR